MNNKKLTWVSHCNNIDWKALSHLYKVAPLGEKPEKMLKIAFTNSKFTYFVYEKNKLIGVGRTLADGVDSAYLCCTISMTHFLWWSIMRVLFKTN